MQIRKKQKKAQKYLTPLSKIKNQNSGNQKTTQHCKGPAEYCQ